MNLVSNLLSKEINCLLILDKNGDKILRFHRTFTIDWFTDNTTEARFHVVSSRSRHGINGLIEDESVSNYSSEGM